MRSPSRAIVLVGDGRPGGLLRSTYGEVMKALVLENIHPAAGGLPELKERWREWVGASLARHEKQSSQEQARRGRACETGARHEVDSTHLGPREKPRQR